MQSAELFIFLCFFLGNIRDRTSQVLNINVIYGHEMNLPVRKFPDKSKCRETEKTAENPRVFHAARV